MLAVAQETTSLPIASVWIASQQLPLFRYFSGQSTALAGFQHPRRFVIGTAHARLTFANSRACFCIFERLKSKLVQSVSFD